MKVSLRNMQRLSRVVPLFSMLITTACNNTPHNTTIYRDEKPLPPPITLDIDVEKVCSEIESANSDSTYYGNVYLILDSISMRDRIPLEYILQKEYGLLMRGVVSRLDTTCLKPFYDAVVESRYMKGGEEIMDEMKYKLSGLREQIGYNQVRPGVYYHATEYPKYPGGLNQLHLAISSLKDSLGTGINSEGRVMFYFTIDTAGRVSNVMIYERLDKMADSISSLIMMKLPKKWVPAKLNGENVSYWMQYAIYWNYDR